MKTVHLTASNEDVVVPSIFCLGRNYAKHAAELNSEVPEEPMIFMKPSSAIVHSGGRVSIPAMTKDFHHETEIFFVIGKEGKNISKEKARSYIAAMGIGFDLTLRDVQNKLKDAGKPWLISKGFDGSAPISDAVPVDGVDFNSLELDLKVNGKPRQHGSYTNTIYKIEEVVAYISRLFTLERGDLIFTGTPEGVAKLNPGDKLHAELLVATQNVVSQRIASERVASLDIEIG